MEFALIAPLLALLLLGIGEVGLGLLHSMTIQNAATTIAARPDALEAELTRLSMTCTTTITEADGIRLVAIDCDNPWPLLGGYLADTLHGEATAALP